MRLEYFFGQATDEVHAANEARIKFRDWYEEQEWPEVHPGLQVSGSLAVVEGSNQLQWFLFTLTVFVHDE